ncbi:MAG: SBBP repeat-containing protein [Candidatus Moraniibacteriota bacterium]|nr:MAG: SBBP repeat-containing protein [Candidatus Moranbacteria bacterium]
MISFFKKTSYKKIYPLPVFLGMFFIFFAFSLEVHAGSVTPEWAERLGGAGYDYGLSITTDADGNVLVTGSVNDTADLNGDGDTTDPNETTASPYGGDDAFISVFDASGTNLWYTRLGGAGYDYGYSITTDADGNVLVTGSVNDTADLNGDGDTTDPNETTASPYGGDDAFISVFDASGTNLWYTRLGGAGYDYGYSITTDADGNVLVTGSVNDTADLNGDGDTTDPNETTASPYGGDDAFISVFDASGTNLWYTRLGGAGYDYGYSITTDADGNVLVTGSVNDTADLNGDGDTTDPNETTASPYGGDDAFISVFDASGTNLWYTRLGGAGYDYGYSITTDADGNVLVTGSVNDTADLNGDGDTTDPNETTASPYGGDDAFISVFDASGTNLWYTRLGGAGYDYGYSITTDADGNVLVTGSVNDTADLNGDGDTTDPNETTASPYGGDDAFISVFDASGTNLWYTRLGGAGYDYGYSITTDADGNVLVTGSVNDTADLNGDGDTTDPNETTASPYGGDDAFISVFSYDFTPPVLTLDSPSSPTGDFTPTITGVATDARNALASVEYQVDSTSGSWSTCTADDGTFDSSSEAFSCQTQELSEGTHTIYLRSTDSADNTTQEGEESEVSIQIDLTYPSLTLNPLPPLTNDSTLILTGTTKDTDGTIQNVEYQLDSLSGSWTPCTSNDSLFEEQEESFTCTLTNLSDGNHIIYIRSTDNVGNSTSIQTSPSEDTTIDTKEPTLEPKSQITLELKGTKKTNIEEGETFYTQKERPKLKGRNEEAKNGTVVVYQRTYLGAKRKIATARIDKDGNWEYSLPKKENDSRHYAIKLIDEAGNESDISQWFKVIYDRKAPTFKTELPKTQNVTRGTRIDFPAKDNFSGIDSYQVKLTPYHKEWKKIPNKKDSFFIIPESVSNGIYTLTLKVTDKAGNRLTHSMTVTVGDGK